MTMTDICPRCGAHEQLTHHPLCQHKNGAPTALSDEQVRQGIAEGTYKFTAYGYAVTIEPHFEPNADLCDSCLQEACCGGPQSGETKWDDLDEAIPF
jgi:hypothetical protein